MVDRPQVGPHHHQGHLTIIVRLCITAHSEKGRVLCTFSHNRGSIYTGIALRAAPGLHPRHIRITKQLGWRFRIRTDSVEIRGWDSGGFGWIPRPRKWNRSTQQNKRRCSNIDRYRSILIASPHRFTSLMWLVEISKTSSRPIEAAQIIADWKTAYQYRTI